MLHGPHHKKERALDISVGAMSTYIYSQVLFLRAPTRFFPFSASITNQFAILGRKMQNPNSADGENHTIRVRRLEISDKRKGFIELLGQLTVADSVSDEEFDRRFEEIGSYGDDHVICVIEDEGLGRIVATGSVIVEKKFVRKCGKAGHIEDVVVDSGYRGKQLGKKVVDFLLDHCRSMGCYKVILDCSVENKSFYEKCGLKQKEIQMAKYFD